jgi:hypothetical protein
MKSESWMEDVQLRKAAAAATVDSSFYAWFKANPQAAKLTGGCCNSESRLVHTRSSALPAEMQAATDGAATCNGLAVRLSELHPRTTARIFDWCKSMHFTV